MANLEVLALDTATPQIRAPGAGDGYSVPRDMTFSPGTTLSVPNAQVTNVKANDGTAAIAIADSTGAVTVSTPTVVSVNSSSDALRITQVGAGNALVVEDSANPDASPVIVNADGLLVAGADTSYLTGLGTRGRLAAVNATANTGQGVQVIKYRATASLGADIELAKSNSSTIGTNTAVASGNTIGTLWFTAADGTGFIPAATIKSEVDGTPGTNDMPGRLTFSTTADGAATPTERMRIDSSGNVGIGGTANAAIRLDSVGTMPAQTTAYNIAARGTISNSTTSSFSGAYVSPTTTAAAFTLTNLFYYNADASSFGAGSTVTNQIGFIAQSNLTGATNNYGFYSNIASGTNRWNFYANGTAQNYFAGRTLFGTTTATSYAGTITPFVQSAGTTANSGFVTSRWAANGSASSYKLAKSRGASVGTNVIVASGDSLGSLSFEGDDGAAFLQAASIDAAVDGTPGTNDMPGRLTFSTTADGAATPTERMRIDNAGNVVVNTAAIATTATDGFLYVPSCAGTPTGTPTTYTGRVPIVVDTTNHKLYFYSGGTWRDAGP